MKQSLALIISNLEVMPGVRPLIMVNPIPCVPFPLGIWLRGRGIKKEGLRPSQTPRLGAGMIRSLQAGAV